MGSNRLNQETLEKIEGLRLNISELERKIHELGFSKTISSLISQKKAEIRFLRRNQHFDKYYNDDDDFD